MRSLWTVRAAGVLAVVLGAVLGLPGAATAQDKGLSFDPRKGTLDGSPLDNLPANIRLLDIRLPDGGAPMRPEWSPDGQRLLFLDAPIGDVWEHDLATGATRNLTEAFLPGGVLRAHHLSNGDVVLCAPAERSAEDPEGDRFRGQLWVFQKPLGTRPPVALGEKCWEGVAVSKRPGSTRIAWNQSTIDFTDFPKVIGEALFGKSQILTGRIVYGSDGTPTIADRTVALDKRDVSLMTPAVEAQDFRSGDQELIFSAYTHKGGQAMGVNLNTRAITDYAPGSHYYEEAEGIDPAGRYVLVERDLTLIPYPSMLDIWRLPLDGSGRFERLTRFDYYKGYGANNPVVSPDGTQMAFSLKVEGEEGEGAGVLLMDLTAPTPPLVFSRTAVRSPMAVSGAGEAPESQATGAPGGPPVSVGREDGDDQADGSAEGIRRRSRRGEGQDIKARDVLGATGTGVGGSQRTRRPGQPLTRGTRYMSLRPPAPRSGWFGQAQAPIASG